MTQTSGRGLDQRPLVLHVLYRFDTGGLENGVVNLLNRLPAERFRHAVLALDRIEPAFAARLVREDVHLFAMHKPPGHALRLYPRIWRLLRDLKPAIVHTRNLAALEVQVVAAAAGVPYRIHGEHGRDVEDLEGTNKKQQFIRRLYSPFVHRYVTVSRELEQYLVRRAGIRQERIQQICNGVDTERFRPAASGREAVEGWPHFGPDVFIVGTVGRMQTVKNQTLLAQAFVRACRSGSVAGARLRLVLVGDGPQRALCRAIVDDAGLGERAWMPGERGDVPQLMRALDAYVLPSLAEGISNTILEAMASGLPVIATDVGGSGELVQEGRTGLLVPTQDIEALAQSLLKLAADPQAAAALGRAGRAEVERRFSLDSMVGSYARLYDQGTNPKVSG